MAWGKVDLCGLDTSKLPVLTPQRMQDTIIKLLEQWQRKQQRHNER